MELFATNLSLTLLHSIWQSALMVLVYLFFVRLTKVTPQGKRNMLYSVLSLQLLLSVTTLVILTLKPAAATFENYYLVALMNETAGWLQPWSFWICSVYLLYVSGRMTFHMYQWNGLKKFNNSNLVKPGVEIRLFTRMKAHHMGVKKVQIWFSENIQTPFTYGFLKPVILLPVALVNCLSIEETEALIIHELTHIRNHDYLLNIFLIVCETLFFFNPFTRYITNNIKLEREKNCDMQVLQFQYSPLLYAEALLKTARFRRNMNDLQLAAVSKKNQLLQRILFFTNEKNNENMKKAFNPLSYAIVLFVAFSSLFIFADEKRTTTKPVTAMNNFIMPAYQYIDESSRATFVRTEPVYTIIEPAEVITKTVTPEPTIVAIKIPAEEITVAEPDFAMYASAKEEENVKDVIIKDEDPATGKTITYVYKSVFINGYWTAIPMMQITESEKADSCLDAEPAPAPFHPEQ